MNGKTKRIISLFLASVTAVAGCCFSTGVTGVAAKTQQEKVFSLKAETEEPAYQKGEEIKIKTALTNITMETAENLLVYFETEDETAGFLPGVTERVFAKIEGGSYVTGNYRCAENPANLKIIEKVPVLTGFFHRFAKCYLALSRGIVGFKQRWENPALLFGKTAKEDLGTLTVEYDGREVVLHFYCRFQLQEKASAHAEQKAVGDSAFAVTCTCQTGVPQKSGILFGAAIDEADFTGGLFYLDGAKGTAGVLTKTRQGVTVLAEKHLSLVANRAYKMKLIVNNDYIKGYVYSNPLDTDPYPVFDIACSFGATGVGTYCSDGAKVGDFVFTDTAETPVTGDYTNPVCYNTPDPYIFFENGTYYLYATNNFHYATSTDLVHWQNKGACANPADLVGEYWFWAPEVYKYQGKYYMLYSTEEHMALAVADAPCGPFRKYSNGFLFDYKGIDGHILFDNNGKIYLYYSYFAPGCSEIWVCEMNNKLVPLPETNHRLLTPEGKEGHINEGPFVLRHNGLYYLTYSGEDYQSPDYSVYAAVSDSPTGPFERQTENPILTRTAFSVGTGHHCFVTDTAGQLWIAYHTHYSTEQIHNRKLCIDKAKFVPTEQGEDVLSVYGPTMTPQSLH